MQYFSKTVIKSSECRISESNMALCAAKFFNSKWYCRRTWDDSIKYSDTEKINNLTLQTVIRSIFRSITFKFTVGHKPPFIYQAEVLWFDGSDCLKQKLQTTESEREQSGKLIFTITITHILTKQTNNTSNRCIHILRATAKPYLWSFIVTFWITAVACMQ